MDFLYLLSLWALLSLSVGVIGVAIGPGIMMLFLSAIWGFLGFALFYLHEKAILQLRLLHAGALLAVLSAGLLTISFGDGNGSSLEAFAWLLFFFVPPSYLGGYLSFVFFHRCRRR